MTVVGAEIGRTFWEIVFSLTDQFSKKDLEVLKQKIDGVAWADILNRVLLQQTEAEPATSNSQILPTTSEANSNTPKSTTEETSTETKIHFGFSPNLTNSNGSFLQRVLQALNFTFERKNSSSKTTHYR